MKQKKYWLRGGVVLSLVGLLIIGVIFELGYRDCFVYNNSEGCMGLVLVSALFGAPIFVFLQEVLRIDLLTFSGFKYLDGILSGGIFFDLACITILGVVTNFMAGALLGWIYGKIKRIIQNRNRVTM